MPIKKIRRAMVLAQNDEGVLMPYMALTKQTSYTIEGTSLANLVFLATSHALWNRKVAYAPVVRITGVVSGCAVKTSTGTNNVELEAGTANVNGTLVTVSADATNAITRGANAKYAVSALHVNASGTVAVTKGTDGDSLDLTGGYGGAGQKPLVAVTECVLAYISTYDDEAAVIPQTNIYAGDSANIAYRIDHIRGGVILNQALENNQTGGIPRTIYAQFYELTNSLLAIGTFEEGTLIIKRDAPVKTPNMDTCWDTYESLGTQGWMFNGKKWRPDQYWVDKMLDPNQDNFLLRIYEDSADAFYYHGYGMLNGDMPLALKRGPVSESLNFTGNGELVRVAA